MKLGGSRMSDKGSGAGNSRVAKRHQTNMLTCELGDVLDISRTGMRVKCSSKPPVRAGQTLQIKLQSSGQRIPVTGRIVWVRRKGLRAYQMGIQFFNVKASVAAALESMALFGFVDFESVGAAGRGATRDEGSDRTVRAAAQLPDYYMTLGVTPSAGLKEIQAAYRSLARKYHPDVNKDPAGVERFIRITEAYEVLRDPKSRKTYDQRSR